MKTGFKETNPDLPNKEKKSPFDFTCPDYDERSSCYVNAGSHHGIGHRQPVGHNGDPKQVVDVLPQNRKNGMKVSEVPRKNLSIEMEE